MMTSSTKEAKLLRSSTLLSEIFTEAKNGAIEKWESAQEPQAREACWTLVRAINTVRETIDYQTDRILREGDSTSGD